MLRTTVLALVATAVNAQNELTEICETHRDTYPAARCLDADGNVVAGITTKAECEIVSTGHVWSDTPSDMVEEVHYEAATCVPAPTCTPKSGVSGAANEANCAAVSYTGMSGDGTVTTSVNQAQCEGILTADPSDGDATACEYTAAAAASACVAGSCS